MAKYNNTYVVLDVETGGLPSRAKIPAVFGKDGGVALTEIALVSVDSETLEITDKASWLIKPYEDNLLYDPEAEKVSGISKLMCVNDGIDIQVVFKEVCAFLKSKFIKSKKPILAGHNFLKFDLEFVENFFLYCKGDNTKFYDQNIIKDTMLMSREKWVESGSFNLPTCCQMAGVEHTQAHRALPDTIATAKLFINLMQSIRGQGVSEAKTKIRYREQFEF